LEFVMLPLQPGRTGLSAPAGTENSRNLNELRLTIARMQAPAVTLDALGETPLGVAEVDRVLGGGFSHGALHEIAARGEAHIAVATGFALGVANLLPSFRGPSEAREPGIHNHGLGLWIPGSRPSAAPRNDSRKSVVWVAEDMALIESGAPYGPGLDCFGLAPERLLTVAGAKAGDVLWTMEEALHCRAVGVAIGELRSTARELDLVATRRLSLAAATHGALALLLRTAPGIEASAAATRWIVGAVPSHGIGPPRFGLALTRNRRGPLGTWMLEWSVADASFVLATHPQFVAGAPADRPHRAHAA
jgi:protein ImuA